MRKLVGSLGTLLALFALAAAAEGPGSRIRTTPEVPQTMGFAPADVPRTEARRCDGLQGERLTECRADNRPADAERRSTAPGATGMGSGAGAGPASGTTGGASFGSSAPR